jgi:hypothetical protein
VLVFAVAWWTGRRAAGPPGPQTRAYDVRDLLVEVSDFDNAPRLGLWRTNAPPTPATAPARTLDGRMGELIRLVRTSVAADSWERRPLAITPLAGQLVVTQTPEVHARIAELFRGLREARSVQVTVEARFVTADEAAIRRLPGALRARLAPGPSADAPADATPLTDEEVTALTDALRADAGTTWFTAPRVTLFSGQRAYVVVSRQRTYSAGVTATRGADGRVTFSPDRGVLEAGAVLDVRATAGADRKSVTLELRPQLATEAGMESQRLPLVPGGAPVLFQWPTVDIRALQTTVNVPDRRTLLVSGFGTARLTTGTTAPTTAPAAAQRTFLLVRPTISAPPAPDRDQGVFPKPR